MLLRRVLTLCASFLVVGSSTLAAVHGGAYAGPGAAVGPLGGPGAGGVGGPAAGGSGPSTAPDSGSPTGDLTDWRLWWRHNQALYLALKAHVHAIGTDTGTEGWFLGEGQTPQRDTLRPTEQQIQREIVPALLAVLAKERNNDLVTGALVALAKIGDGGDASAGARIEGAITRFLADSNQEIRETAAVALGILASPRAIPALAHLLWNTEEGRRTVEAAEVDYRTRAFAAYGLGLVGARSDSEIDRQLIVSILRRALEADDTSSRDLEVACLIALGLVPLGTIATPSGLEGVRATPPERSRLAQLDYVRAILRDEKRENLARAQCPVTLARLLAARAGTIDPELARCRVEIARELFELVRRERNGEIVQSCVLALGQIGTNAGGDELDARIRHTLASVPDEVSEPQARAFALVAAAEAGARAGQDQPADGIAGARELLARQTIDGKSTLRPWAALASGVLCWRLEAGLEPGEAVDPSAVTLRRVLCIALDDERSQDRLGAYALAAGLAQSSESEPRLLKLLEKELPDEPRGQVALGLALLGSREALAPLRAIVARATYRPELLRQGAMALAILGDKDVATQLASMLAGSRSLASQAAVCSALGFIGDRRSVEPLLALLANRLVTDKARAFAAVALGNVADKELLPWNAKIGMGLNYRAAPATLTDPLTGTGILDFL